MVGEAANKRKTKFAGVNNISPPPSCVGSEKQVIGNFLNDSSMWHEFKGRISPEAFYDTAHQNLVRTFFEMDARNIAIDVVTLHDWAKRKGNDSELKDSNYWTYLTEIALGVNNEYHISNINECYRQRLLWELHHNSIQAIEKGELEEVKRFREQILDLEYSNKKTTPIILERHDVKSKKWILEWLIPDGFPSIIYGAGGLGKSFLALYLAVLACLGNREFVGYKFLREPLNVMLIDYELDADTQGERAEKIARGLNLSSIPTNLHYYEPENSIQKEIPNIRGFIKRANIGLVIIDSIGASGTDGESVEDVVRLLTLLKNLDVATILLDHQSKMQSGERYRNKTAYGSVYKENLARSVFQLSRLNQGTNKVSLSLRHVKTNFGELVGDIIFDMCFEDNCVRFAESQTKTKDEAELEMVRQAISELEDSGAKTNQKSIIEKLKGVLGRDRVIALLDMGVDKLWELEKGGRKELLYKLKNL